MMTQENMLARYKVLHELGRGAIGAVYAARDRETGGVVALKRLDPALLSKSDPNFADRFLKHARSARLLTHRNIVKIHDAGEVGGTVYVAMEMLDGESLGNILRGAPLPVARAIQIARDIACGLAHAHLEGVLHGGLKPSDIIVSRSGVVKITDFGIGQLGQAALLSGAPAGSLRYISPEQVRGDPVDHRCDIFSLGALFYELLTHRAPFAGDSPREILENILHAKPPLPSELNPHVPRALDAIVFSMLAGQPAARMPGVPILLRDLQGLEEGLGLGSGPSAGTDEATASVPPAGPEPRLRTPDPDRLRIRADSSAGEELQHRDRSTDGAAFDYEKAIVMMERESRRERLSGSRPPIFTALVLVLAVLGIGVAGFTYYGSVPSELGIAANRIQKSLATALGEPQARAMGDGQAEQESPGILPASNPMPPKPLAAEPSPLAQTESVAARESGQPADRGIAASRMQEAPAIAPKAPVLAQTESAAARASEPPASATPAPARSKQPTAEAPQQQRGGTARVILSVSPRGEIYIDGKHHGGTPPITTFDLEPGMHRIEVRSGSRTPYLTYVTVQTGDVRRIRHDFDVSRAVYPSKRASWQKSDRAAR